MDGLAPLFSVYMFSLVPALLIGAAPLPRAAIVAVVMWTNGALIVGAGSAYCLCRFHRQASELLLPACRLLLRRAIVCLTAVVVVLPTISFWMFAPGSRPWLALITAAPLIAALTVGLCMRTSAERSSGSRHANSRYTHRTASQDIRIFMGGPFVPLSAGLRARGLAAIGLILWAAPPVLCLMLSVRAWKILVTTYLTVTGLVIWGWFMVALARFGSHSASNFAELALLPGLGDATRRRHALYRATLARPLLLAFCALAVFSLFTAWQSHSPARIERSFFCGILVLLSCCAMAFQLLMAKGSSGKRVGLVFAINSVLVPFVITQTVLTLPDRPWFSHSAVPWIYDLFLAVLAAGPLTVIWVYTNGVARQAHPFLAPSE
jgi:hypothetical protein